MALADRWPLLTEPRKAALVFGLTALLICPLTYLVAHFTPSRLNLIWFLGAPLVASLMIYGRPASRLIAFVLLLPAAYLLAMLTAFVFRLSY